MMLHRLSSICGIESVGEAWRAAHLGAPSSFITILRLLSTALLLALKLGLSLDGIVSAKLLSQTPFCSFIKLGAHRFSLSCQDFAIELLDVPLRLLLPALRSETIYFATGTNSLIRREKHFVASREKFIL